jgi:hypothetical protein
MRNALGVDERALRERGDGERTTKVQGYYCAAGSLASWHCGWCFELLTPMSSLRYRAAAPDIHLDSRALQGAIASNMPICDISVF